MPRMRDREVPYGMKGGEHNGHEEGKAREEGDEEDRQEEISSHH